MPAIDNQRHINIDDVAFAQWFIIGDAMADHMVDRGADGAAIATIHQWSGIGTMIHRELEAQTVEIVCRHTRAHGIIDQIKCLRSQATGLTHTLEGLRAVNLDFARLSALG